MNHSFININLPVPSLEPPQLFLSSIFYATRVKKYIIGCLGAIALAAVFVCAKIILFSQPSEADTQKTPPQQTLRVGIQVGHWKISELPDEFPVMRASGSGTEAGGYTEWEVCLDIAQRVQALLAAKGVTVDLLPATIPADYTADAFVSIHADGNADTTTSGYKIAASSYDTTGVAATLASAIDVAYGKNTTMSHDETITDDMTDYYAFNSQRFTHAISSKTPGVIIETGFLTNPQNRLLLTKDPQAAAEGIAAGIFTFLQTDTSQ